MEPMDPADLRVSDSDRERIAEVLREAAGDGRIDLDELDERLGATYAAKTYRDLVPITVDLPGQQPAAPHPARTPARLTPPGTEPSHGVSFAMTSETRRTGVWDIGRQHTTVAVMGSVEVIVDAHTQVHVQGVGIMGSFSEGRQRVDADLDDSSPVVRLTGLALMGSVEVHRQEASGLDRGARTVLG